MINNLVVIFIIIGIGLFYMIPSSTYANNNLRNRKSYIFIISLILILQSGLRNVAVGADTYQYYETFERVKTIKWNELLAIFSDYYLNGIGKDPGYIVFQKVIQIFIFDYQIYLIIIALFFFYSFGYFILKNTDKIIDILFAYIVYSCLFFTFFSVTGIRQTIAVSIVVMSIKYIQNRKLFNFLILIALSSTIHKSSLIFIPIYFINKDNIVKYLLYSLLIIVPFLIVLSEPISNFLKNLDSNYSQYEYIEDLKPYNFFLFQIIVFTLTLTYVKKIINYKNSINIILISTSFLSILFTSQIFQINSFMRIIYYFSIFYTLLIPKIINEVSLSRKIPYNQLVFICIIILIMIFMKSSFDFEYNFFWEKMELGSNYK